MKFCVCYSDRRKLIVVLFHPARLRQIKVHRKAIYLLFYPINILHCLRMKLLVFEYYRTFLSCRLFSLLFLIQSFSFDLFTKSLKCKFTLSSEYWESPISVLLQTLEIMQYDLCPIECCVLCLLPFFRTIYLVYVFVFKSNRLLLSRCCYNYQKAKRRYWGWYVQ